MYWLVSSVSGVIRCVYHIEKHWLRSPCGAPAPALAQPTSRKTVEGGVQVTNCQRSTYPRKLLAQAVIGGGTISSIQRPTRTRISSHSLLVGVVASRGSPASVF